MTPGAVALLGLLSLAGLNRDRAVRVECERGVIAYRFETQAGTLITYGGVTHRVGSTGTLELLANRNAGVIRIGTRSYSLPLMGKPDEFGVLVVRLPAP